MKNISKKTLEDLEFYQILSLASKKCSTEVGKKEILTTEPRNLILEVEELISKTNEYFHSLEIEKQIPNHGFEDAYYEISLLSVENSKIEVEGFRKILEINEKSNTLIQFFKKNKDLFPTLHKSTSHLEIIKELPVEINKIINRFGEIKDTASEKLSSIRKQINNVRSKIGQSFGAALSTYHTSGFLDEIRETIIGNRRVLAVKSMYRRKIKGVIHGSSKTGSIIYIEPQATLMYSQELQNLVYDEKEEVDFILRKLTNFSRIYEEDLNNYSKFLTCIDITAAKAYLAREMNAKKPKVSAKKELDLKKAYHPLLYLNNEEKKIPTYPQNLHFDVNNRIMVISGPNAGGKSITLKTVGLIQLMFQSGFLVPVSEQSHMCVFDKILTDIGDNQSIENELSTYSYRLKNMQKFLKKCDEETLFLIDEFGTGSDPELGGALAEIFLEVFYERKSLGAITTHYSNLKLLANELPNMINANMEFDSKNLKPTFNLVTGEAGSSFTFEVAEKNGISRDLINKAKKKTDRGKVRFDASIAKLQKERASLNKNSKILQEVSIKNKQENEKLDILNQKIKIKLEQYQKLYDKEKRMITIGNKVNNAALKFFNSNKKRALVAELLRIVEYENSKRKTKPAAVLRKEKRNEISVKKEIEKKVENIKYEKKTIIKKSKKRFLNKYNFKEGDSVRLIDSKSVGIIEKLEKNKVIINYGSFKTKTTTDELEIV
ncbi:MAG: DNA mismatch repair protein MutS [Bacteroidota bacterium]|nr:DNA mismatch repair protein MutS [Bacteroidota bacterium]